MYTCNTRTKIIHNPSCGYAQHLKHGKDMDIRDAIDRGYRFCSHCSSVKKAFDKEKDLLNERCAGKKISYRMEQGILVVYTPCGFWRVVPGCDDIAGMNLWHQNGCSCHKLEKFGNYHNQHVRRWSLVKMFHVIEKHDTYREKVPNGTKPPVINKNLKKGCKKYKAQQHRIEKFEKKRERINSINNVFFLLDQIEKQRNAQKRA